MGSEIPKKLRMVAPSTSIIARKIMLLMAILRASERKTCGGASPTSPRKTSADPSGLISGKRTLKAIRKEFQINKNVLLALSILLRANRLNLSGKMLIKRHGWILLNFLGRF